MNKKIIFLDIDGTLTVPGSNTPPESALKAIHEAREKGNLVFLCTGRNYDMLSPVLEYGFDGVIASSGAYILCGKEKIFDCPMTEQEKEVVMGTLEEQGIFRTIECFEGSFTDEGFKIFLENNASENGNSELLRWRRQIEDSLNIRPMSEYSGQPVYKVVFMSPEKESVEKATEVLNQDFKFCIQDMDQYGIVNGELLKKEYDKGQGVERVCRYYGIPISETIGFGDSMNDLEMFQKTAISVCMENGSETLKEMADDICPSVLEDGILKAFQKYELV